MLKSARRYYALTKPGIWRGNAVAATAGFFLASGGHVHGGRLVAMLVGISLVMASGCVFNNYIDRGIDRVMARTRSRALVTGTIPAGVALAYGAALGVAGLAVLLAGTNVLTAALALGGFVAYVALYGVAKRRSVHGTLVGSISGSTPPVIGYAAASGQLDAGAGLLFLILTFWQMPHFYAIAMYRLGDYRAAGIPVLPAVAGLDATRRQIMVYIGLFTLVAVSLSAAGYAGLTYTASMAVLGLWWFTTGLRTRYSGAEEAWARRMFGASLVVLMGWAIMVSAAPYLP